MREITIKIHEISVDGLPSYESQNDVSGKLIGHVAFLFDGNIVNGWPLMRDVHPDLYTEEAIYKRSDLANSIGVPPAEQDRILDMCGRTATLWEADSDVGRAGTFAGVTHWVEFPAPLWDIERGDA